LDDNTTGSYNTAVGSAALRYDTTGAYNTALGYLAMFSSTPNNLTGSYNTAIGSSALYAIQTTASANTAVGRNAGYSVSTGSNNTILGYEVAYGTLTTGSNNILIGTSNAVTTPAADTTNHLNIGNTIYGNLSTDSVGIGTATPYATLDVNGYAKLKTNSAAPVACSATYKGSIAYTGGTTNYLCFCNGTGWMQAHSPATACTW